MTPQEEDRLEKLALQAQQLAKEGKPAEAEALARQVPTADCLEGYFQEKVAAFVEIAAALVRMRSPAAEALLREAEGLAANLRRDGIWHEADALASIGDVWAALDQRTEALRLFRNAVAAIDAASFRDDGSHSVLARLARKLRALGEAGEADVIEASLPPWRQRRTPETDCGEQ